MRSASLIGRVLAYLASRQPHALGGDALQGPWKLERLESAVWRRLAWNE